MVCGIDVKEEKYILTVGACLSIFSLAIVFLLFYYFKIPNLKRHPTSKFFYLTEFLFLILIISSHSNT
jgi:hypothetical protein